MTGAVGLPLRQAVRALMIDRDDRVLLVKLDLRGWIGWVLPGGGLETGEDMHDALRRELREETGLVDAFVGPLVCERRQIGPAVAPGFGGQQDSIYLVPCHDFALAPTFTEDELRAEGIVDMRWFTVEEVRQSTDKVVPRKLPELVERVLEYGGSVEPLVVEVLEHSER